MKHLFKIAWRNIKRQPLHSMINIGGLAVGMTAVVLIMMWVLKELTYDRYHPNSERIYLVKTTQYIDKNESHVMENSPYGLHEAATKQLPEVEKATHIMRTQKNELTLRANGNKFTAEWAIYADKNWFDIFHFEFLEGSAKNIFAHPYSIALTQSKAKMLFGNKEAVGNMLQIDSTNYIVAAVLANNPINSSFQFDVLIPMEARFNTPARLVEVNYWGNLGHKTFIKLRAGADAAKTNDKITGLYKSNRSHINISSSLLPLAQLHFDTSFQWSAFVHGNYTNVQIFMVLGIALLLAAGINYVNLSVARAGLRSKEIGVRKIVGARRKHLFLQLMSESFLTSSIALAITILLVNVCLPFFNRYTGTPFQFNITDPYMAMLLGGMLLSILLLTGIYPAILLSSFNPLNLFRSRTMARPKNVFLGKSLIVTQFSFAVMMTVGAIIVYQQLQFIQRQQAGYNRSQVLALHPPESAFWKLVKDSVDVLAPIQQELAALSQVQTVSRTANGSLVNNSFVTSGDLDWDGKPADIEPSYTGFTGDGNLNKIMNFQFLQGHWFDTERSDDVILNETAVKQFGIAQPVIGRRFKKGKIIGVVRDFYYKSMHEKIGPVVIRHNAAPFGSLMVLTQPGAAVRMKKAAEEIFKKYFPGETFLYAFADEEFEKLYQEDSKASTFTLIFSSLSIFISCIGLLGLVTLTAAKRKKEIGIRKVLGAGVSSIVLLVSKDFIKLVFVSICIASPIAWWAMNKWLQDFAYRIEVQWWMFALAGLLALVIAFITLGFQSIKAAVTNPVKSLRSE